MKKYISGFGSVCALTVCLLATFTRRLQGTYPNAMASGFCFVWCFGGLLRRGPGICTALQRLHAMALYIPFRRLTSGRDKYHTNSNAPNQHDPHDQRAPDKTDYHSCRRVAAPMRLCSTETSSLTRLDVRERAQRPNLQCSKYV